MNTSQPSSRETLPAPSLTFDGRKTGLIMENGEVVEIRLLKPVARCERGSSSSLSTGAGIRLPPIASLFPAALYRPNHQLSSSSLSMPIPPRSDTPCENQPSPADSGVIQSHEAQREPSPAPTRSINPSGSANVPGGPAITTPSTTAPHNLERGPVGLPEGQTQASSTVVHPPSSSSHGSSRAKPKRKTGVQKKANQQPRPRTGRGRGRPRKEKRVEIGEPSGYRFIKAAPTPEARSEGILMGRNYAASGNRTASGARPAGTSNHGARVMNEIHTTPMPRVESDGVRLTDPLVARAQDVDMQDGANRGAVDKAHDATAK
ncbi:hypothetical protein CVT26_012874 [Gymnopilus dilepis]|uniref:Uncharacterized protein n=1 Tax=Gymnopilus dilepis TaxID=231916 RepID=A0A409YNX2_9AGAR|nr:hypothetical protein CVT26_012874 [Gymnopilus dilepis]